MKTQVPFGRGIRLVRCTQRAVPAEGICLVLLNRSLSTQLPVLDPGLR
ncbi:hypothetical protein RB5676 [Rhodopirellula baltica SH 1]|uniref:Uncharacterized protein n=1 Tax=Rhodopirellula baltica (strain DSM 10527 / NCIMB 13988 / SH1) TaxID=243090 RepID=Q7URG6_RHOBA|nr:hypothetical protein RB5676 [Rhodopirellula baltica SH 1]